MASMTDTSNNTVRQNAADGGGSSDNNNKTLCDEEDDGSDKIMTILNKTRELSSLSDRQEYEKRVLTFQASTYYAKPACLSPLFCARFG
ncbi:MAG: type V secretory pathway adhesin AidA [Bacillariaceae sp.]|jgi:type V secretory pathway adhesin AidA